MSELGIAGFENAELVGNGGFGSVYRCRQVALNRTVAIKIFRTGDTEDSELKAFERECAAVGQLDWCPQIVTVFSTGITQWGLPYMVMEYASGGSLQDHLRAKGTIDESAARRIAVHIAGALAHAHDAGVLHRDVKPGNVLISRTGDPVLADFGIARTLGGSRTTAAGISGTIAYSAPEVLNGEPATVRSDIYSLGATLYSAVAGRGPFATGSQDSVATMIAQALTGPEADVARLGLSPQFTAVLVRCLRRDPGDRFADAHELLLHLAVDDGAATVDGSGADAPAASVGPGWDAALRSAGSTAVEVTPRSRSGRPWPVATDYVAAIQAPAFPVAGVAGFESATLVRDSLGMPSSASGQTAVVFELAHESGPLALRCFTREPVDGARRYREMARHLNVIDLPAMTPAVWLENAIEVNGDSWPAVLMPWMPGVPLNVAVEEMLDRADGLRSLADTWVELTTKLAEAGVAHGDLQCGNVLVDQQHVHLVDFDGIYVPTSTTPPAESGHPHFQHPRRAERHWGPDVDAFSVMAIRLSLLALAADPELWRFNADENLILSQPDFQDPGTSPVFAALSQVADDEVRRLTTRLRAYCDDPVPPTLGRVLDDLADRRSTLDASDTVVITTASPMVGLPDSSTALRAFDETPWWDDSADVETPAPTAVPTPVPIPALTSEPASVHSVVIGPVHTGSSTSVGALLGRNAVVSGVLAGLTAGLVICLIQRILDPVLSADAAPVTFLALVSVLLTGIFSSFSSATMGAWGQAARAFALGALLGPLIVLGPMAILFVYVDAHSVPGTAPAGVILAAWLIAGTGVGIAAGIVRGGLKAVANGIWGGLLGGLVGGLAHFGTGPEFVEYEKGSWALVIDPLSATTIAVVVACAVIGASLGFVDRLTKSAWITIIEGPWRGREVIIDRDVTTIGSSSTATLRLSDSGSVWKEHLVIRRAGGDYTCETRAPIEVNGAPVAGGQTRRLVTGDVVRVAGTFLRLDVKEPHR